MLVLAECNAVPRLNGLTYAEVPSAAANDQGQGAGDPLNGRRVQSEFWGGVLGWGSNLAAR
jgi:hypothetical protein